jgi:hypothetical protein
MAEPKKKPPCGGNQGKPGRKETCETAKPKTLETRSQPNRPREYSDVSLSLCPRKGLWKSKAWLRGLLPSLRVIPSEGPVEQAPYRDLERKAKPTMQVWL